MTNKNFDKEQIETEDELDARFSRMKILPRGTFATPKGATDLKNCKVKITILLDADILGFFKERATEKGNPPYQTQINNELRKAMENLKQPKGEVITMEMLDNPAFISALAEKLKAA